MMSSVVYNEHSITDMPFLFEIFNYKKKPVLVCAQFFIILSLDY